MVSWVPLDAVNALLSIAADDLDAIIHGGNTIFCHPANMHIFAPAFHLARDLFHRQRPANNSSTAIHKSLMKEHGIRLVPQTAGRYSRQRGV
jgi:hypothetical protein